MNLTGTRTEGYVRLMSSGKIGAQVRWKTAKADDGLESRLDSYFSRLAKEAKKARKVFESHREIVDGRVQYHWTGNGVGRGALFYDSKTSRVFFVEVTSDRGDSTLKPLRALLATFETSDSDGDLWSLYGLRLRAPLMLRVDKIVLESGRTRLVLKQRWIRIDAERWGFGEELRRKHPFLDWTRAAFRMPKKSEALCETENEVQLGARRGPIHFFACARFEPDRNQIVGFRVQMLGSKWSPTCDWLI